MTACINEIPAMEHPLSRHWDQPSRKVIIVDKNWAIMSSETLDKLNEYSCSNPSGVYAGKMWKRRCTNGWQLCWFGESDVPGEVLIHRRMVIVEDEESMMADEVYAVVVEESVHIPGDERSRTNPGHGYPAHDRHFQTFREFKSKEEWQKWIEQEELRERGKTKYRAFICRPVTINKNITIDVEE